MKTADISVDLVGSYGSDLTIVNAARVSFHKESEWENSEEEYMDFTDGRYRGKHPEFKGVLSNQDAKLINYLAKHKHFSPFNHSFISVRVKAPIFVARQLQKHRFMPWNEVSRRYVDEDPEFYMPSLRERADNVKQGSSDLLMPSMWNQAGREHMKNMLEYYKSAIAAGMAPEVARAFLPQNMMTEWVWSGTLGAFCDMLMLRLDPHTQYESRIVAEKIKALIEPVFPVSVKARLENYQ